jgi:hypothetical protein
VADLRVIQEIRNDFAHELHGLSFDSPEVQEKCGRLREMGVIGPDRVQAPGVARNRFIVSVVLLAQRIASAAEAAKHQQRNIGPLYKLAKMVLGGVETPTEPKPEP